MIFTKDFYILRPVIGCLLMIFLFFNSQAVQAQINGNESAILEWYDQTIGYQSIGLYEGNVFKYVNVSPDSHPFYESRHGLSGSIVFNGQFYGNLILYFDISKGQLLLTPMADLGSVDFLLINQEAISMFYLKNKKFKKITGDLDTPSGFYEVLYEGESGVQLLAHRQKSAEIGDGKFTFIASNKYYLQIGDLVPVLIKKKSLFENYPDKISMLKKFISKNNLNLSGKKEQHLFQLAKFIESDILE